MLTAVWLATAFAQPSTPDYDPAADTRITAYPNGMVSSAHGGASDVGVQVLRQGGNAVDAAIATGFALAALYPYAGNLGGGGFMLVHLAHSPAGPTNIFVDYRETAPAAAGARTYLDGSGRPVLGEGSSTTGYRASGVPGTVAGLHLAFSKYGSGRLRWRDLLEPARRIAAGESTNRMTPATFRSLSANAARLGAYPESRRVYLNNGKLWPPGAVWRQPDLAATLGRLQRGKDGWRDFYEGETAARIVRDMEAHGGLITAMDLRDYHPIERTPLSAPYGEYTVVTAPPPSSGVFLLEMLGMLRASQTPITRNNLHSAPTVHLLTEIMRRAYRDRAAYLGDPGPPGAADKNRFVPVPVDGLLDSTYQKARIASDASQPWAYRVDHATPSAGLPPGRPTGWELVPGSAPGTGDRHESSDTTHFSVVDHEGNAVANTYTLNDAYGSGVTIRGTGILMNNEMDDFYTGSSDAYLTNQIPTDPVVAGRRPVSSMIPTIVFLHDGRLRLVTGSPGGRTIVNTVLEVLIHVLDCGMKVDEAVETLRFHHQWQPDRTLYEPSPGPGIPPCFTSDTVLALRAMGHDCVIPREADQATDSEPGGNGRLRPTQGDAETIVVDARTGWRLGHSDPRAPDSRAAGY